MGVLIRLIHFFLISLLLFNTFFAIIVLIPNLPPYTNFTSIEIEPTQQWTGPLAPNTYLNNVQRLYEDKLLGPEAFQIWNGELYTGLGTGEIVKVSSGGHVTFVTKIGQPCTGIVEEHVCGRPLGFVIDEKNKLLYVADAYHGIWKVNLVTDKKQLLVSPKVPIDGRTPKIINSVALYKNGDLFWTDSSSDFYLRDGMYTILADPSGRLFHYNAAKNESKVLLDNLWFANSLIVSPNNDFVIVSETNKYRVVKYYVDGPKKGTSEVFVAGLPGLPDNIRSLPDGSGVLVSLYNVFNDEHPLLTKTMAATPLARKFLARLIRLIEIPLELLNTQVPYYIFEEMLYTIGSFSSLTRFSSGMSGIVQLDWNGNIIAAYYNTDGSIKHISDAVVFNDKLYTGSPHTHNFIGAVPAPPLLKKAFSVKEKQKPQEKENVPKINKPVDQKKQEIKVNEKPKQTPQQTQPPAVKQQEKLQKEPAKQNTVPKDKTKISPKEAEIKTNEIPKTAKAVPKAQEKPKEPEGKSKTVPKVQQKQKVDTIPNAPKVDAKPSAPKVDAKPNAPKVDTTPSASKGDAKRNAPKEDAKPSASKLDAKPNAPKEDVKPNAPKVDAKTNAPKVDAKPSASKVDAKPNSPKVDAKPNAPKVDAKPSASKVDAKPNSLKVDAKPSATKKSDESSKTKPVSQETDPKKAEIKPKTPKESKSKEKVKKAENPNVESAKPKKEIPIEEVIPSDTAKPSNEKLKVIKKSGPQEIPNPHL